MAADILIYQTAIVPVGDDQQQHLELARALARKFNNRFGNVLREPKALIEKNVSRIMGLDDQKKKMSKSAESKDNYIALLDPPEEIRRKIKRAITDSGKEIKYNAKEKPAISNLMTIYSAFSDLSFAKIEEKYKHASYVDFKNELAEILVEKLEALQENYGKLIKNTKALEEMLHENAKKASLIANETLAEVKEKIGLVL